MSAGGTSSSETCTDTSTPRTTPRRSRLRPKRRPPLQRRRPGQPGAGIGKSTRVDRGEVRRRHEGQPRTRARAVPARTCGLLATNARREMDRKDPPRALPVLGPHPRRTAHRDHGGNSARRRRDRARGRPDDAVAHALALFEESTAWDNIALLGFDEGRLTRAARRQTPMEGVRALVHGHFPTEEVDHAGKPMGDRHRGGEPRARTPHGAANRRTNTRGTHDRSSMKHGQRHAT